MFLVMLVSIFLHFIFVLVPFYWVRLRDVFLWFLLLQEISFEMIQWAGRSESPVADFLQQAGAGYAEADYHRTG